MTENYLSIQYIINIYKRYEIIKINSNVDCGIGPDERLVLRQAGWH